MQARCRLGFERRVDAAISQTALEAKTLTQSSEHAVIATVEHGDHSGGSCVERHVRFLRGPEAMEQNSQLTGHGNHGLALGLLASASCQMETPLSER